MLFILQMKGLQRNEDAIKNKSRYHITKNFHQLFSLFRMEVTKSIYNEDTHAGPSFSLKNRLARLVWNIVEVIFFKLSPKPFHAWRSFLLRLFGAKVGKNVHVYPHVKIWAPWNIDLADECGIGNGVILYSQDKIRVGYRAVISQGTHVCAGTHDYDEPGFKLITKPVWIGAHVWIAAEAFIHPGITIGEGCVIGARSVVTKNMPPWMVCAGHPCKPIKERESTRVKLQFSKNENKS